MSNAGVTPERISLVPSRLTLSIISSRARIAVASMDMTCRMLRMRTFGRFLHYADSVLELVGHTKKKRAVDLKDLNTGRYAARSDGKAVLLIIILLQFAGDMAYFCHF